MPHPAIESILEDDELAADILDMAASGKGLEKARQFNIPDEIIERALNPRDQSVTFDDRPMTEAIVLEVGRPVLLVRQDTFETPASGVWRQRLSASRGRLEQILPSVGRIEISNHPDFEWAGTGWMVTEDVVVTNRHVALTFARRNGNSFAYIRGVLGEMSARVDFKEEHDVRDAREVVVSKVVFIEEPVDGAPDLALLRLESSTGELPAPVALQTGKPGQFIAAIGYPARDSRNDERAMEKIFGNIYNVKRLSPGEIKDYPPTADHFTHDCTTLGGNSGSVLVDLEMGNAVGLHFAGRFRQANFALKAATVERYLRKFRLTVAVPAAPPKPVPQIDDEALPIGTYADRLGYDEGFHGPGFKLRLPSMTRTLRKKIAPTTQARRPGILDYTHYSTVLHSDRNLAIYSVVNIDGTQLRRVPGSFSWLIDPRAAVDDQTDNELYKDNDLDRGHMVRRLDPVWGTEEEAKKANRDTFHYANSCPQVHAFNAGIWLKLEDYFLDNAGAELLRLTVFTGPIFKASDKEYRGVKIPREFWKVAVMVVGEGSARRFMAAGFRLSQADRLGPFEAFLLGEGRTEQVPIPEIERETSLRFPQIRAADTLGTTESAAPRVIRRLTDIILTLPARETRAKPKRKTARAAR